MRRRRSRRSAPFRVGPRRGSIARCRHRPARPAPRRRHGQGRGQRPHRGPARPSARGGFLSIPSARPPPRSARRPRRRRLAGRGSSVRLRAARPPLPSPAQAPLGGGGSHTGLPIPLPFLMIHFEGGPTEPPLRIHFGGRGPTELPHPLPSPPSPFWRMRDPPSPTAPTPLRALPRPRARPLCHPGRGWEGTRKYGEGVVEVTSGEVGFWGWGARKFGVGGHGRV